MDQPDDLTRAGGYLLRRDALELGLDDNWLCREVKLGRLVRIRQGAYVPRARWGAMDSVARHLARARASQDLTPGPTALSHISALAEFGCPLWKAPLDRVHLTRLDDGPSRCEAGVVHHCGTVGADDVAEHHGRLVTSPTRATLEAMTLLRTDSSMVSGDWMLHRGLTSQPALWQGHEFMERWPGTLGLEVKIRLLDGRSESVGETLSRSLFRAMGLPRPTLQFHVYDATGQLIGITDFGWPEHNVYGEFDGKIKYGRLLKPGQEPGEVVFAEKRREDRIRGATDGIMVRHTWGDLHERSEPSVKLARLLRAAA